MTICQVSEDVVFKLIQLTLPLNSQTNQMSVSYFGNLNLGLKHPPEDGLPWQNFWGQGRCLYSTLPAIRPLSLPNTRFWSTTFHHNDQFPWSFN